MEQAQPLNLNKPQKRFVIQQPSEGTSIWARGTGKSFIIGWLMRLIVETMPRSSWVIQGESYKQILTRTLPGTLGALERFGYRYEKDYYIRRKPPAKAGFDRPYEAPLDYDHYLIFKNGCGFHLATQDPGGGSVRGLNTDGIIADESLLLNQDKFAAETSATNRGNDRYFSSIPYHHGVFHFTSMPSGQNAQWLFDSGKYYQNESGYYKDNGLDFRALRNQIIDLEIQFIKDKDEKRRLALWAEIRELKLKLRFYKSKAGILYSEADAFDNLENLGIRFIEQQYRDLPDYIFLTEILNKRLEAIEGGFYPHLSRLKHGYQSYNNSFITSLEWGDENLQSIDCRYDGDLVRGLPLRLAVDWGSKINSLTITQFLRSQNELRFLKNLYVKHPLILDDLAKEFCRYYESHNDKNVFLSYDHTGNTDMANSNLTYTEQFSDILTKNGWYVHLAPAEAPLTHQEKYLLWHKILKEDDPNLPIVRFNTENCKELLISMEQAPAKETSKGIEKDKKSERKKMPQEEATHLSDTADMHVNSLFKHFLDYMPAFVGNLFSSRR